MAPAVRAALDLVGRDGFPRGEIDEADDALVVAQREELAVGRVGVPPVLRAELQCPEVLAGLEAEEGDLLLWPLEDVVSRMRKADVETGRIWCRVELQLPG